MFDPNADGQVVREKLGLAGKFVVTYAGALGQANDIPTILRAAKTLNENSDIHFLLVGDGKEKSNLEVLATEYGLKNVTFTGAVPKTDVSGMLAASDVCTATLMSIPMFKTTYPNKVFDYMAAGKPTILGIDGVIRQVIEAAHGGIFVPPSDDKALAEAILRLYGDQSTLKQMGQSARAYVEVYFDRRKQAYDFADLLEHVAARDN